MNKLLTFLSNIITGFFEGLAAFFLWAFQKIWSLLVDVLVWLFSHLPDPCCVVETVAMFDWLATSLHTGGVFRWLLWMFELVQFDFAIKVVICALLARFFIRRLPIIG